MEQLFVFFKQKTAYEVRISDWSSDVCSSDLAENVAAGGRDARVDRGRGARAGRGEEADARSRVRRAEPGGAVAARAQALARRHAGDAAQGEIGRASCRERVCQYV